MNTLTVPIRKTSFPLGVEVPVLGQGTWGFGERPENSQDEIDALRFGLDLGMTLIDTAEMYGDGAAEEVVGKALEGRRDQAFIVDKVLPQNASRKGTVQACERSLRRLKTDRIDLYLLHWRGSVPLAATLAGFDDLLRADKIRSWGVSNFDVADMEELAALEGGSAVATNQVLYNLTRRGIEYDLMPWCERHDIPLMAYSPLEQGRLMEDPAIRRIADAHSATPAQIALAWVLRKEGLIAIPKASTRHHVEQNRSALDIQLAPDELAALDRAFPPPRRKVPLEMICALIGCVYAKPALALARNGMACRPASGRGSRELGALCQAGLCALASAASHYGANSVSAKGYGRAPRLVSRRYSERQVRLRGVTERRLWRRIEKA